jgi:hypothetical protein
VMAYSTWYSRPAGAAADGVVRRGGASRLVQA